MKFTHRPAAAAAAAAAAAVASGAGRGAGYRIGVALTTAVLAATLVPAAPAHAVQAAPCRPVLTGVSVPAVVHAGDKVTGRVTLSCAPRVKVKVALKSDQPNLVVPSTVTVGPRRSSATVPVSAKLVNGAQYKARVTARYKTRSRAGVVTVNPGLKRFGISPSSDINGVSVDLGLTGPAPEGGLTVRLGSDSPLVKLPATMHLQGGSVGAAFSAREVGTVTKDTKITISGTLGTRTLRASKVLIPPFDGSQRMSIYFDRSTERYGLEHYESFYVRLSNPAPAEGVDVVVRLRGDTSALLLERTTESVLERNTTADFRFSTADVTRTHRVVVEATAMGATTTTTVTVRPRITDVVLPESVKSGTTFHGTITMAGPSDVDTKIYLQPSWGILHPQESVTIPKGATSATFEATSVPVSEPSEVFVTAYLAHTDFISNRATLTP